jgi:DnaJ-class molecular chaperone
MTAEVMSHKCKYCHGSGWIAIERKSGYGYRCPDCDGSGTLYPEDDEEVQEEEEEESDDDNSHNETKP